MVQIDDSQWDRMYPMRPKKKKKKEWWWQGDKVEQMVNSWSNPVWEVVLRNQRECHRSCTSYLIWKQEVLTREWYQSALIFLYFAQPIETLKFYIYLFCIRVLLGPWTLAMFITQSSGKNFWFITLFLSLGIHIP